MQHLTAILGRCLQFDRQVSVGEEPLQSGAEGDRMVETLYWGLATGYAYDKSTGAVYQGGPANGRWEWSKLEKGADGVAQLIAIYKEKADPRFVEVPGRLLGARNEGGAK